MNEARTPVAKLTACLTSALLLMGLLSCAESENTLPEPLAAADDTSSQTAITAGENQEPDLPTIIVKNMLLRVEIVRTEIERRRGLQERHSLAEDTGMLFVFAPPQQELSFWMDKTYIPLSIAFIDEKGVIVRIAHMKPLDRTSHPSGKPALYALEVNQNWFERYNVKVGDRVDLSGVPAHLLQGE